MNLSYIALLLSFLTLQGCGNHSDVRPAEENVPLYSDVAFKEYVIQFEEHYGKSVAHIPIVFAKLDSGTAGICFQSKVGGQVVYSYIKIDKEYWQTISDYQKINLVFHEYGHCALMRGHTAIDNVSRCPISYMNPSVLTPQCAIDNYNHYIKELFGE